MTETWKLPRDEEGVSADMESLREGIAPDVDGNESKKLLFVYKCDQITRLSCRQSYVD